MILAYSFPPQIGGVQKLLSDLAGSMPPGDVYVLAGRYDPEPEEHHDASLPYPVERVVLEPKSIIDRAIIKGQSFLTSPPAAFYEHCGRKSMARALKISNKFDPDIVISGWGYMIKTALKLKSSGKIASAFAHGGDVMDAFKDNLIASWWQKLDRIVTNSNYTKSLLIDIGVNEHNVISVPLGIDPSIANEPSIEPDLEALGIEGRQIILTVCRLVPHKGTDKLIEAMPSIMAEAPDAVLVIAGDGPYREYLEETAGNSVRSGDIIFTGEISGAEKRGWYKTCDVFAMPSRHDTVTNGVEGYGYTFLEANAFGKPVVGGNAGGIPDAIKDGYSGVLVDPLDLDDISGILVKFLKDPELAEKTGANGRKWVETDRNVKICVRNAIEAFKSGL